VALTTIDAPHDGREHIHVVTQGSDYGDKLLQACDDRSKSNFL
jgi:hypothetical protein